MIDRLAILSANAIEITNASRLRVACSNIGNAEHTFDVRTLIAKPDGHLVESFDQITVISLAIGNQLFINLTAGHLISVTVATSETSIDRGLLYTLVELIRGTVVDATSRLMLTSGYVTSSKAVNYPLTPFEDSLTGYGQITSQIWGGAGAGIEAQFTFSSFEQSRFVAGQILLTTSADVAVRTVTLSGDNADGNLWTVAARTTQIASLTRQYILWAGPNLPNDVGTIIYLPIPTRDIERGTTYTTATTNIQAADAFTAGILTRKQNLIL